MSKSEFLLESFVVYLQLIIIAMTSQLGLFSAVVEFQFDPWLFLEVMRQQFSTSLWNGWAFSFFFSCFLYSPLMRRVLFLIL
ncbi:hypothetical protein RCL_jg21091.t1 [Rhizophagus clarus]|uniref:Uncharacterized protein n=1 Tax=Rhizophagus clarus TaxID=94130 RepID=A0A8H3LR06_9GLOM|nr:hypothetical protein RCL_jg21091.t1 [Rhizophagus clarus]